MGGYRCGLPKRMAGYLIVNGPEVGRWVAKRIQGGFCEDRTVAIGLKKDDDLIAGVIYENWNHQSIWCHIAIDGKITPSYLAAIFDYPFNIAQVEKIIVPVGSDNEESIRLVKKMGFTEEGRIKEGRLDGDIVFLTLNRKDCKYLGERYYGKIKSSATTSA